MNKIFMFSILMISIFCCSSVLAITPTPTGTTTPTLLNRSANTAGNVVNDVGQGIGGVINGAGNAINSIGDATKNIGRDISNGTSTNPTIDNTTGMGYSATRTAFDTTSTTWTWIVVAIAVAAIVALVWYYNSETNREERRRKDRY